MSQSEIIFQTENMIKEKLSNDFSGHDWFHVNRVRNLALELGSTEGGDLFIIELGALLHDIADWKFNDGSEQVGIELAGNWLDKFNLDKDVINEILQIIKDISYKGAGVQTPMKTINGNIVQDADRLDALGAIGIARTFAYGGFAGQSMYDPAIKVNLHKNFDEYKSLKSTSINHFYEKLFLLPDRLNTNMAKSMAKEKIKFMENFVENFISDWGN